MDKNLHQGHRERLKNRFLKTGLSSFEDHNVLEVLLFYSIPRKDTNKIAHQLINRFGSLSAVFDAPIEELTKIKGITHNSAVLIKIIPSLSSVYMSDKIEIGSILNTTEKMGEFLKPLYIDKTTECVYAICLDSKLKVIKYELLFEGSINAVSITNRRVVEFAALNKASVLVISHNHPNGIAIPSQADIMTTEKIKNALALIEVELLDHIIVADNDFVSLSDSRML
ncbi:MAG: JAB domain-containing protein [Oscillospiraceae bacterium]